MMLLPLFSARTVTGKGTPAVTLLGVLSTKWSKELEPALPTDMVMVLRADPR